MFYIDRAGLALCVSIWKFEGVSIFRIHVTICVHPNARCVFRDLYRGRRRLRKGWRDGCRTSQQQQKAEQAKEDR